MKLITTIIIGLLAFNYSFSQSNEDIKKGLDVAMMFKMGDALPDGSITMPGEYVLDAAGNLIGQKFLKSYFPDRQLATNEGVMSVSYENGKLSRGNEKNGCNSYNFDLYNFSVSYNDQNKIARIDKPWARRGNSKEFIRKSFVYTYDGTRLARVTVNEVIGQGSNSLNAQPVFEYIVKDAVLAWKSEQEVTTTVSGYRAKSKAKDKEQVNSKRSYTIRVGKGNVFVETIEPTTKISDEYMLGKNQLIRTRVQDSFKAVTTFTLDDKGKVMQVNSLEYLNDQLTKRIETKVIYSPSSTTPDNDCGSYKNSVNIYDGTGTLIQESTDTQIRIKNPDGTWGPWKTYTY